MARGGSPRTLIGMRVALIVLVGCATAHADDWEVKRSPFDARTAEAWRAALRKDPDDAGAFRRWVEPYRRYRSVAQLEREQGARAAGGDFVERYLWARLARERGDHPEAAKRFRGALEARPGDERATVSLADELQRSGQLPEARALLEKLASPSDPRGRLRRLADLARDQHDDPAQDRYLRELAEASPGAVEVQRERAEALAAHGRAKEALAVWRGEILPKLAAQPEKLAEGWRRVGELAESSGDDAGALEALRRAAQLVPRGHWLRRDTADKILGIYRKRDDLRALIAESERAAPGERGFVEWELLARLYEEVGDAPAAIAAWKRALAADPRALDARQRLIALYERAGRDDEVTAEYERLIVLAPGEPRFQLALAERWARAGEAGRKRALGLLARLAARSPGDPSVHGALAELYGRWGELDRAQREQELLVRLEPGEEAHLVDLGELHWQRGRRKQALETWRRLAAGARDRPAGMARLADVLQDHDMAGEAIELYEKAIKLAPADWSLRRGLASALERVHRASEAEEQWVEIFQRARDPKQRALRVEARQRLIALAYREGHLANRVRQMRSRFDGPPPDDEWGAPLAEAYLKMGRNEDAEQTLLAVARRAGTVEAKGEAELGLAQVQRARRRPKEAIAALERAAQLLPQRAKEIYEQIAALSLELYRDDQAVAYARRAVALAPGDAQAEVRLAEIDEKRDDDAGAEAAYARALKIDPRQWRVQLQLARLELRRGGAETAARRYREVALHAPEEELVLDAARRAMDLDEYLGTLGELERALTPLAYAPAPKPVYRKLLVELYARYAGPLAKAARRGDAQAARELKRLGEHGWKPLAEALVDGDATEQRAAVQLLGQAGNPSAAGPLLKLAERAPREGERDRGGVEIELRVRAAVAAAPLGDAQAIGEWERLARDPEKQLKMAALAGLSRIDGARAQGAAERALDDGSPDVQAAACLALARQALRAGGRPRSPSPRVRATLRGWVGDAARPDAVRASCAAALGAARDAEAGPALEELLHSGGDDGPRAAAWAIGVIGARRSVGQLARSVFVGLDEDLRRTAAEAIAALSRGTAPALERPPLADPEEPLEGRAIAARLARPTGGFTAPPPAGDGAAALIDRAAAGLDDALSRHRDLQLRALADLAGDGEAPGLGPLPASPQLLSPDERAAWRAIAARVLDRLGPRLAQLARSSDPQLAAHAVTIAGGSASPDAAKAVRGALAHPAEEVRLAAIAVLARAPSGELEDAAERAQAIAPHCAAHPWRERAGCADALAALAALPRPDRAAAQAYAASAIAPLAADGNGFLRERAVRALGTLGPAALAPLAPRARDPLPEVRRAAAAALGHAGPAARPTLAALARDPDPSVRQAAERALAHPPPP